jgi:hypothetical protein
MPSIINASSTGSGGIVQTADASGVLQLQSNGTVALTINTDASITLAGAQSINTTMATTTTYQTDLTLQAQPASGSTGTSSAGGVQILFKGTTDGAIANSTLAAIVGFVQTVSVNNAGGLAIRCQDSAVAGLVDSARFSSGGLIALRGATNVSGGTGISFPATQNASTDANTLDDYEEGTWTPRDAGGVALTLGTPAYYRKVGSLVTITFDATWTTSTSPLLTGLPFTNSSTHAGSCFAYTSAGSIRSLLILQGTTTGDIYNGISTQSSVASTRVIGSFVYQTST